VIDILIPTIFRAHYLADLIVNIAGTTEGAHRTIFVADEEDHETIDELQSLGAGYVVAPGPLPRAMNAGFRAGAGDLVLATNDDVYFHAGWLEAAERAFEDPSVMVVGTRDLTPISENGDHTTQPIMRRAYVEDPGAVWGETGTIYWEGYHHGWVETELWQLACHRGVARFVPECVIEHRHPDWGTRPPDATDQRGNMQGKAEDSASFQNRRHEWMTCPV